MTRHFLALAMLLIWACSGAPSQPTDDDLTEKPVISEEIPDDEPETDETVPITAEDVSFTSGELELEGEVVRPQQPRDGARGVVIVHDAGPLGRDGVTSDVFGVELPVEVPVYRSLAETLAAHGYVVLIYDKRTCVEASAPWCSYPRDYARQRDDLGTALVEDAVAAANVLTGRDDVAAVSFVGHGQGAGVAVVAAHEAGARSVVMLAPTVYSPREIIAHQTARSIELLRQRIEKVGDTPEADLLEKQLADLKHQSEALEKPEGDEPLLGLPAATWSDLETLHRRYLELVPDTSVPVRALMPDVDPGEPDDGAERVETVVRPHGEDSFLLVPELSRAMVSIAEEDDPTAVAPAVEEFLVDAL